MLARWLELLRRNRNYRLLWIAQVVSNLGDWFYALSVYGLLLEFTGNKAQAVALAVVLQVLPQTLAAPAAGVVNDRASRRRVMIGSDFARFAIVLGMLLVRSRGTVWLAYPLLFLETVAAAFFEPARNAVIPDVVAEADVLPANVLGSVTWSTCLAVGAGLGGAAAVLLGRDAVFALNAASFLASAFLIGRMHFAEPHMAGRPPLCLRDALAFRPVVEGVRYILGDARLRATVLVKFGVGLFGANNVLLPILGARVFPVRWAGVGGAQAGMLGMSMLMGARGVGSLIGPVVAGWWAGERHARLRQGILAGFLFAAAGYLGLGAAGSLAVAIAAVVLAHTGSSTNWVFSTTLLQSYTDPRFRGRVFAADTGLLTLGISLSSYAAGAAVDFGVSPRTAAAALGALMLLPAALWLLALRARPEHLERCGSGVNSEENHC